MVAVATLLIAVACAFFVETSLRAEARVRAAELAGLKARQIDRQLDHGLSVTYALASLVKLGQGRVADFERVAQEFLPHYPGVSALQLAPAGVIRQSVPLAGNEKAIGHDLLADEKRNQEARLAIETRRLTLAGPFKLIQGGEAVVGRLPVYLGDAGERFWGFAVALISLDDFLHAIELDDLVGQGYAYELGRWSPESGERQVFARSPGSLAANPVGIALEVPNGRWFLDIAPQGGWLVGGRLALEALLGLALVAVACLAVSWHVRTRRRLADNELRYQNLYESTPAMMHSIDRNGKIVSVSRTWLETLGYRREEVIGRPSADFLTEDSRRLAVEQVLPEFFRSGRCDDVPYQMLTHDGRVLDVLLSACGERDETGKIARSLAVIQDVTERKRTEQQLHRLLAEQRAIIENDLVGIVRVRERHIVWANPAFEQMLGYAPGELNGLPTLTHYPDEAAYLAFGAAAYPVLAAGRVFHSQVEHRHKDGRTVWSSVSGAMLDAASGESLWAFVDISELKLAYSRIARSEQRMELALAGADLGMWDWHIASGGFTCNRRMVEMLGYAEGELKLDGSRFAAMINLADVPQVHRKLFRHLKGESDMFEVEYRLRHRDEHWLWILCRGRVVERNAEGRAQRMTGTILDISERKASDEAIRSREARLSNLIAAMQDLVIVFDAGGEVVEYFYPAQGRHPWRDDTVPRGGRYVELLPPAIRERLADAMGEILLDGRPRSLEYTLDLDGRQLISAATLSPIIEAGASFPSGFLAVVRDVTAEHLYRQEIENLSRRNTLLLESVGEGIFGLDPDGLTSFVNGTALELLGLTEDEVISQPSHELFHHHHEDGEPYPRAECPIFLTLQDGQPRHSAGESFWRRDGSSFPVYLNVAPIIEDGIAQGAVVVFRDITESRRQEEEIRRLAFYDPLTQLPNRRLLTERLGRALVASKRSEQQGALFFIDLDNFKNLNDSLGHDVGDLLLKQVAERLLACMREVDTVARFGGDEFVLLCEGLGAERQQAADNVCGIAAKILAALDQPYALGRHAHVSTPSIGAALFAGAAKAADELLKEADIAMYQAKAAGRNTFRIFEA